MKVAQYEVLGYVFISDPSRMGRSRSAPYAGERRERDQEPNVSIVAARTDISFCIISQHFVLGYFHQVPPGPVLFAYSQVLS